MTGASFCPAVLEWPGHPHGIVPCDRWTEHRGRHHFAWLDDDGPHEIYW